MAGKLERKVIVKRFLIYDSKQFNELARKLIFIMCTENIYALEVSAIFH